MPTDKPKPAMAETASTSEKAIRDGRLPALCRTAPPPVSTYPVLLTIGIYIFSISLIVTLAIGKIVPFFGALVGCLLGARFLTTAYHTYEKRRRDDSDG
ncbi:hypothetical protein EDC14_101965 [Hydrogenispora ethanolica]|jgi:hypothetical protein|uniref:Uncharacterized protein n=1 Tax=Hydrogenispora ethanolica TaxID=1082276 RepID=A0A4R1REJ1_HYDET|nr:hypothetical protein [Hydrogenispora ethanolica]TCL64259.1 hypothetical protein EDC14_101965 [Hydrogenispora ethanolica]